MGNRGQTPITLALLGASLAAQEPEVPRPGRIDFTTLLKEVDPGPQAPLSSLFPKWLSEWIAKETTDADRAAVAELDAQRFAALATRFASLERASSARQLGELAKTIALLESEHARSQGANPYLTRLLINAYDIASQLSSVLVQLRSSADQILAATSDRDDRERVREALGVLERVIRPGNLLLRHTVAGVLAGNDRGELRVAALRTLATASRFHGSTEIEVALLEEAARLEGKAVPAREWANLAMGYCAIFDAPRAKIALTRAGSGTFAARVQSRLATLEQGLAALPKDPLAARFERCHLWIELGRSARADRELATLATEHPKDARVHVGLATVAHERFDGATVEKELALANTLEPHDVRYHEIALRRGLWQAFLEAIQKMRSGAADKDVRAGLAKRLGDLAGAGTEATKGASSRSHLAEVLRRMFLRGLALEEGAVEQRIAHALVDCEPELRALLRRWPHEEGFAHLLRACALFTPKAVDSANTLNGLPPSLPTAQAWLAHFAARGGEFSIERIREALGDTDAPEAAAVIGDAFALIASRTGDAEAWKSAREAYERALATSSSPRLVNNFGVVLAHLGDAETALATLRTAAGTEASGLAALNAILARVPAKDAPPEFVSELAGWFTSTGDTERDPHDRPQDLAAAWLAVLAERIDKTSEVTRWSKEAIAHAPNPAQPYDTPFASRGAVLERQVLWNDATQASGLRSLTAGVRAEVWLTFPSPLSELELRRRALR